MVSRSNGVFALLVLITFSLSVSINVDPNDPCFTAAVFERASYINLLRLADNPLVTINESLHLYDLVAKKASKNGASVILFPENGIFSEPRNRIKLSKAIEEIPEANGTVNPCLINLVPSPIIYSLSCTARKYGIYVIANTGERKKCSEIDAKCRDGYYYFNTDVVFDDKGTLVAKYNKYHLYSEPAYDAPQKQQYSYFDSPFGRVGLFICFDMIFKQPGIDLVRKYNVDTIAFSTHWFDEAPFLTAHQYQQAWSIMNNVNLLAANINLLRLGSTGSGIYSGSKGAINYRHDLNEGNSVLLLATLAKSSKSSTKAECPNKTKTILIDANDSRSPKLLPTGRNVYHFMSVPLNNFNHQKLVNLNDSLTLCQHNFCCHLTYYVGEVGNPDNHFYFAVGERIRDGKYHWCEEMCTIVAVNSQTGSYSLTSSTTFKYVNIKATFPTEFIYPSVLGNEWNLVPKSNWIYDHNGNTTQLGIQNASIPITNIGLYGRCYQYDPIF